MNIVLAAALAIFSLPCLSRADEFDLVNEASFRLGGYLSLTKITLDGQDNVADGGSAVGLRLIHNLDPQVGIGVEANFLNAGQHVSDVLINNAVSTTKLRTTDALGIVRFRFGRERFRPYVLGGFGLYSNSFELDAQPQPGLFWHDTGTAETRTLVDTSQVGAALALETGFDYRFTPSFGAGAFWAWHYQSRQTYDATPAGQSLGLGGIEGSFSGLMIGGSLTARF